MKKTASRRSFYAFFACGREDGEFRAPARVTFFFCKKKVTKENHLDLRSKDPLARGGQVQIWRCVLAGGVRRSSLSVKRTVPAFTGAEASATACLSHGRGVCFYRVGDYQIAPIAARSTAMGRWRLTPPGYGGTLPVGAGWGVSCSGTSNFLLLSKESYQRKPLKPTV